MCSRSKFFRIFSCVPALFLGSVLVGCDMDVQDSGELPNVNEQPGQASDFDRQPGQASDFDRQPGQAPDDDARGPDISTESTETDVTIPDVDIDTEEEEKDVTVPSFDVDVPQENEDERQ